MLNRIIRRLKLVYSSQSWVRGLVKRASASRPYFWLARAKFKDRSQKDAKGPFNLVIETSNFCNARCLMCPNSSLKRSKQVMAPKVFEKIVERVREEKLPINKVFFSGLGEPLSDPQIISRIKALKGLGLSVKLYTNASLLAPGISRELVNLGLDEINISFNGTTPGQYRQVMGLDFEQTKNQIENLIRLKREKKSSCPKILISSVLIEENKKDVEKHLKAWRNRVDSVTVTMAHQWGGGVGIKSDFRASPTERTYPCRSLWQTFMIDSLGNFVVCCRDYESRYVLGNVLTHSFAEIQKSPILLAFQKQHEKFSQEKLPEMCKLCNFPFQDGVEWYLPRSID